jgi:hypothetical protein
MDRVQDGKGIEESPEFQAALSEACEREYRRWLYGGGVAANSKEKIADTMEEIQRQRREVEEKVAEARKHADRIRREAEFLSPPMREITENLRRKHGSGSGLICPRCGETDSRGNRLNGRPWCMKCNLPFVTREKAAKWVEPKKPKPAELTFKHFEFARVRK